MAETCAVTGTSGLAERNRNYGKQALELIGGLQKDGYLSTTDVALAKTLLSGCDTYINRQVHDNLKGTIDSIKSTPIQGIFPSEEAKKAAFQAEFKKVIADPDENNKTDDSAETESKKGNVNNAIATLLLAIGSAKKVACGEKVYTPPKALTPKQAEDSKVLPGPNSQTKEGTIANLISLAEKETDIDKKISIFKRVADKAETNFANLKNPSEQAKEEYETALGVKKLADALLAAGNKGYALEKYKECLSELPASVFPLK